MATIGTYTCSGCKRVGIGRRWQHGTDIYCSVVCAERNGWDVMEGQPYNPALYEKPGPGMTLREMVEIAKSRRRPRTFA